MDSGTAAPTVSSFCTKPQCWGGTSARKDRLPRSLAPPISPPSCLLFYTQISTDERLPRLPETSRWLATRRGGLFGKQAPPSATVVKAPAAPAKKHKKHPNVAAAATPGLDPQKAYSQAVHRTLLAVGAAFAFGIGLYVVEGKTPAMEFFAGYLIEESLSVDNIFVFIMLFEYFKVPAEYQPRALTWGIIGAVAMRGAMIFLGVAAIQRFRWVVLLFAGILLGSAFKLLAGGEDEGDLSENLMLRVAGRLVNAVDEYDGDRFFTKVGLCACIFRLYYWRMGRKNGMVEKGREKGRQTARLMLTPPSAPQHPPTNEQRNGKRFATPLFMCLLCIELSDFVFAVDSIPAVLGVSKARSGLTNGEITTRPNRGPGGL